MKKHGFILYVEDDPINREMGIKALKRHNIFNVLAPTSHEECRQMILEKDISMAILDFQLTAWIKDNLNVPILVNEQAFTNGIELMRFITKRNPTMQIGMFSSSPGHLRQQLPEPLPDTVRLLSQNQYKKQFSHDWIPDYVNQFYEFTVRVQPCSYGQGSMPRNVQLYYAKRVRSFLTIGSHIWKAGAWAWQVHIQEKKNEKLGEAFVQYQPLPPANDTFVVKIDRDDYRLSEFHCPEQEIHIYRHEVARADYILQQHSDKTFGLLLELVQLELLLTLFFAGNITSRKLIQHLRTMSDSAKLESQKILFKKWSAREECQSKEDVYQRMRPFQEEGLDAILDIYCGRIDQLEPPRAFVKLNSLSPEKQVCAETFNASILQRQCIDEHAAFEYTIYHPSEGSEAFHIEPL